MPEKSESDIARIARLSGLKPEQVRYDLRGHCNLRGNQLSITISDSEALKIISEKRNKIVWIDGRETTPTEYPYLVSNKFEIRIICDNDDAMKFCLWATSYPYEFPFFIWAYITPDMLPKGK